MSALATLSVPAFVPAALDASRVGTWEHDGKTKLLRCDNVMAVLYGLSAEEAAAGVPMTRINAALHPADRERGRRKREAILCRGGLFVIEYRLATTPEQWILARGRYERDDEGLMHGRGIVIDVTESKQDGYAEGQALFMGPPEAPASLLEEIADHAIAARAAIDRLDGAYTPTLRRTVDALLKVLGYALARRTDPDAP